MKLDATHFVRVLYVCGIFSFGCSHLGLGGKLDACHLVTKTDAESILQRTVRFDKETTAEAIRLSSSPGVTGTCVYTTGDERASSRLVIGYRLYDNAEIIKAGFEDARNRLWKDQAQEGVDGVGDEALLLGGRMIVLRKDKTWLQIGVTTGQDGEFSLEALKSVARRVGASL